MHALTRMALRPAGDVTTGSVDASSSDTQTPQLPRYQLTPGEEIAVVAAYVAPFVILSVLAYRFVSRRL